MKVCSATANRVLLNYVCQSNFQAAEGSSHRAARPNSSIREGAGRPRWAWQGGQWCARSKHWCETPTLQLPWVHSAHPTWMHPLCKALKALSHLFSGTLPEPTVLLALPRLVNIFSTYRRPRQDKTKASPSTCFSQGSHTSLQFLLMSSTAFWGAWGSDQLHHCLSSEACNYLCICICCLWCQLPP